MQIRYKGLEPCVYTDAPFIGTRIIGIQCHCGCSGCCNEKLKNNCNIKTVDSKELIQYVKTLPLSEGIILGGLEWSEQPKEMLELINLAKKENLKIMVYTHWYIDEFLEKFPELANTGIYVKCGPYIENLPPKYDTENDVMLGSENQYIVQL